MIRSPGLAASIAVWMLPLAATWVGALPPIVTVTVSIVDLPLSPLVMTNSPHCAAEPPYCACCCIPHAGTEPAGGVVPVIKVSVHVTP